MPRFFTFGRPLRPVSAPDPQPDHVAADPARIERMLSRALARSTGGWAVLDVADRFSRAPRRVRVAGRDLVVWRTPDGSLRAGPDECPHMGASLCGARVDAEGRVVCPWHGLALGDRRHGAWAPIVVHDDGLFAWVRLPELGAIGESLFETPLVCERPARALSAVVHLEVACEPRDVIANRLDPWHGVHFHPYAFSRLRVLSEDETQITARVVYRVLGPLAIEVDARFSCPDARTVVMTIVDGDGAGSVVETHATPIDRGRTAVIEATLATSDREAFPKFLRLQRLIRPLLARRAAKLWADDAKYAERLAELRSKRPRAPIERRAELRTSRKDA